MGQYYNPLLQEVRTGEIKHFSTTIDGVFGGQKLTEHSYMKVDLIETIAYMLYHEPTRLAWLGDYSTQEELDKLNIPFNKNNWGGEDIENAPTLDHTELLLINHTTKEYIDLKQYMAFNKEYFDDWYCMSPLALLTAIGNQRGGGDYYGVNEENVGIWAWNVLSIEDRDFDVTDFTKRQDLFFTEEYRTHTYYDKETEKEQYDKFVENLKRQTQALQEIGVLAEVDL